MNNSTPSRLLPTLASIGFAAVVFGGDSCVITKFGGPGCPHLHLWWYLPAGIFLSGVGLSVSRLSRAFRARPDLQYGIIVAGYFAALGARFAIDPVIHHDWYVYPRFLVGLAMLTLIVSPLCRSWCGTLLSLSSAALVLYHWLG